MKLTDLDRAILMRQTLRPSADCVIAMLEGDERDADIMREREWDRHWSAIQQYELDYVY